MMFKISLALIVCICQVLAQSPCDPLDGGPFLGTKPTLNMRIYEASTEDLEKYPDSDRYKDELRLSGNIGDTGASGISFEVMNDFRFIDPRDLFQFETEAVSGKNIIKLVRAVDRDGPTDSLEDDVNLFSFTIGCTPASNTSIQIFYDVRIQIMDVNDNYPQFAMLPENVTVSESTPEGTVITKVSATDIDFPLNGSVSYSIVSSNVDDGSDHFSIDPVTGEVKVKVMLDYESLSQGHFYNVDIMATDSDAEAPKSAKTTLKVVVTDDDDQGPVFEYEGCFRHKGSCAWPKYTTYASHMKRGEPLILHPVPNKIGKPVTIKARDLDPSMNEVRFSIASTIPPGKEAYFTVETSHASGAFYTAIVKQKTPLVVSEGFEIFLKVEEQTGHQRHDMAMIYFLGENSGESKPEVPDNGDNPQKTTLNGTSQDSLALIVVVAILGAFLLCLTIAFVCFVMRRGNKSAKYASNGVTNEAYNRN